MKDLILYQCRKFLESLGEVADGTDCLCLANALEESMSVAISYLEMLGFAPAEQTDGNEEKTVLLSGDGNVNILLAYSPDKCELHVTVLAE